MLEPGLTFVSPHLWIWNVIKMSCSCMRPDMHFAVIILENTIAKGHRFYTTSALQKSVSGWVHTNMLGYAITDDLHLEFQEVLLRMMCYFSTIICNGRVELEGKPLKI